MKIAFLLILLFIVGCGHSRNNEKARKFARDSKIVKVLRFDGFVQNYAIVENNNGERMKVLLFGKPVVPGEKWKVSPMSNGEYPGFVFEELCK